MTRKLLIVQRKKTAPLQSWRTCRGLGLLSDNGFCIVNLYGTSSAALNVPRGSAPWDETAAPAPSKAVKRQIASTENGFLIVSIATTDWYVDLALLRRTNQKLVQVASSDGRTCPFRFVPRSLWSFASLSSMR